MLGGGVAFLACRRAVSSARATCSLPGQEHGVEVLTAALAEPFLQLVRNHGSMHPVLALARAERLGCDFGFDVVMGQLVNIREGGIVDCVTVAKGALQSAVSAAIALLTTGVVILPADSKREFRPRP